MPDVFLAVNAHGPEGELALAGTPVPAHWPAELVDDLVATGGAGDTAYVEGILGHPVVLEPEPPIEPGPDPRQPGLSPSDVEPAEEGE